MSRVEPRRLHADRVALPRGEVSPFWPEPLPAAIGRGLRDDLAPFFWPVVFGAICVMAIALRLSFSQRDLSFAAIAAMVTVFLVAAFVCRWAGEAMASEPVPAVRFDRMFGLGAILLSAGVGSVVLAVLAQQLPWRLELLAVTAAMALLGLGQATAASRPWVGAMQVVAVTVPTASGMALFWRDWVGIAASLGLVAYATLVVAIAWRTYLDQVALVAARDEQRAERGRLAVAVGQHAVRAGGPRR